MSQATPNETPDALRARLDAALGPGHRVGFLASKDCFVVFRTPDPKPLLARSRATVQKWRHPMATMCFVVRFEERKRS